jgi:hypothetical protein
MQAEAKSPETVQIRAYQIWEAEGRPHGRDQAHWYQAERELSANAHILAEPANSPTRKASPKTRRRSDVNGVGTGRRRKATEARV